MSSHPYHTRQNSKGVNILDPILSGSDSEATHPQQQSAITADNMYTQAQQQQQQPAAGMQHLSEDRPGMPGINTGMRAVDDDMPASGSNFATLGMQNNTQHRDREAAMLTQMLHTCCRLLLLLCLCVYVVCSCC